MRFGEANERLEQPDRRPRGIAHVGLALQLVVARQDLLGRRRHLRLEGRLDEGDVRLSAANKRRFRVRAVS